MRGRWAEMGRLVDDEVVDAFAVRGEPEQIPARLLARYVCDRVSFPPPPGRANAGRRWWTRSTGPSPRGQ